MELQLIKKPYTICFTGNPVSFVFAVTPYRSQEQANDIKLIVSVEVESSPGSFIFSSVKECIYNPANDGTVTFDIQSILKSFVTQNIPPLAQAIPNVLPDHSKRYRISYRLLKNNLLVDGTVDTSENFYILKGGMSFQQWHPKKFFTEILVNQKPFLKYAVKQEKVFVDEYKFLSWLYPYDDNLTQNINVKVHLDDDSEVDDTFNSITCSQWQVCITPAGFSQLDIASLVPAGKIPVWYEVSVAIDDVGTVICKPQRFYIEYRAFYKTTDLLFVNSLGGIETIRLRGEIEANADYEKQQAEKIIPPEYFRNAILDNTIEDNYNREQEKFVGDTGFMAKDSLDRLRDLVNNKQVYEINDSRLLPVNILTKNEKWYTNKQNLFSAGIEWQHAFTNEFYTPSGTVAVYSTCPAVENLSVRQTATNTLSISYALETGYNKIQIKIIVSGVEYVYVHVGNHAQFDQVFTNPAPDEGTADIVVQGRTICNDLIDPVDMGPVKTVNITVKGNLAPVGNDDYYSIASGYTTPVALVGSVLDNDYDPNGDPIECVLVVNEPTTLGGTISIDVAGKVTYQPPTAETAGVTDTFTYTVKESGGATPLSSTAKINIAISSTTDPTGKVYVKITQRNISRSASGTFFTGWFYTHGEEWLEFYQDAAGTIPKDVSGLGLVINVRKETQSTEPGVPNATDNSTYNAISYEMKIYTGLLEQHRQNGSQYRRYIFTVQPGTGYTPI